MFFDKINIIRVKALLLNMNLLVSEQWRVVASGQPRVRCHPMQSIAVQSLFASNIHYLLFCLSFVSFLQKLLIYLLFSCYIVYHLFICYFDSFKLSVPEVYQNEAKTCWKHCSQLVLQKLMQYWYEYNNNQK